MNHSRHAALWALLAAMASSGCSSAIASHPSIAFAASRADGPNGAPVCAVAGATSTIARKVMVTSGVEAMSTKDGIALGFATNAKQGVALRLDPSTMETTLLGTDAATSAIQRVVPIAGEEGRITLDTDCPSHRVGGARTVVCHAPFVVGAEGGSIVWAASAGDEPRDLWQVEGKAAIEGLRGVSLGHGRGYAIAFRHGDSIRLGILDGDKTPGPLAWIPGNGGEVGLPAIAASRTDGSVYVAWDARTAPDGPWAVRGVALRPDAAQPGEPRWLARAEAGADVDAIAPSIATTKDGRLLVAWLEGDMNGRRVRAAAFDANLAPIAPAFDVSDQARDVIGSAHASLTRDGRGAVAYVASTPAGFEALVTPIACGGMN